MRASLPANEPDRLAALSRYEVLDSEPEDAFDDIARVACEVTGAPVALVTLVDAERQWFKARVNLDQVTETPRDMSLCAHAILEPSRVLVIPDLREDPRTADNPLVQSTGFCFYAGAPLVTDDGLALGTLCVFDREPRSLESSQVDALRTLARRVMRELELRRELLELGAMVRAGAMPRAPDVLQAVIDRSPAPVYVKDRRGRYILANRALHDLIGSDVLGKTDFELFPEEVAAAYVANDRRVIETGAPVEAEEANPDGERTFLSLKFPLLDWSGEAFALCGISTDITDRTNLQRQAGLLKAAQMVDVLDRVADGFVALSRDWRYTYVNEKAAQMFGRTTEDLIGKHIWTEFPEGVGQPFQLNYERALREQVVVKFEDYYAPWNRWYENRVYPSADGVAIFFTDITERRQAEEERRRLLAHLVDAQESERSRIAAGIHDDSIQSLGGLGLRLDMLADHVADEQGREALDQVRATVRESIGRLRTLVFDLKPPALESGLVPALNELFAQRTGEWGFEHSVENRLDAEPDEDVRSVLYRVACEALSNVHKHARASRVDVVVETSDGGVAMSLRDDGLGFSPSPSRPGHFGLTSMRERAELAGGRLSVRSEPGHGTTVEAWVPSGG